MCPQDLRPGVIASLFLSLEKPERVWNKFAFLVFRYMASMAGLIERLCVIFVNQDINFWSHFNQFPCFSSDLFCYSIKVNC